ncbi:sporozoite surface protein 2-like [Esox lucius]|uniref:sporozoite surface protein 2-like n=1 Tax=Esox lucius TaxID=8010 RepID=UPI001477513D|nr:sporozoite surface protein 2-like [Esox lucius]
MKLKPDGADRFPPLNRAPLKQASTEASSSNSSARPSLCHLPQAFAEERHTKELSLADVLKKPKVLPDSWSGSPNSSHQPEVMRPGMGRAEDTPLRSTGQSVRPVGWIQNKVQTFRPEVHQQCPSRRLIPLGRIHDEVQHPDPELTEGRNHRSNTRLPVIPVSRNQDEVQPSKPEVTNYTKPPHATRLPVIPVSRNQDEVQPSKPEVTKVTKPSHATRLPVIPVSRNQDEAQSSKPEVTKDTKPSHATGLPVIPVSRNQDEVQSSKPEVTKDTKPPHATRLPVIPVSRNQDEVQPSKPEVTKDTKPSHATRLPVIPVSQNQDEVQPSKPEVTKVTKPSHATGLPVIPVSRNQDEVQPSKPEVTKVTKPSHAIGLPVIPVSRNQDEVQPSKPEVTKVTKPSHAIGLPVIPVSRNQDEVQPSKPEVTKDTKPPHATGLPVIPFVSMPENTQPSKPKGRPTNRQSTNKRKLKASKPVVPTVPDSQPIRTVNLDCQEAPPTNQVVPEEPCIFNNVYVVSMPEAGQPVEAYARTMNQPKEIPRPMISVNTGPLLARRAQRNSLHGHMAPKPPVGPRPKMFPSIAQGNMSLVEAKSSEMNHKKGAKGLRDLQSSSQAQRFVPLNVEVTMTSSRRVKSAGPSKQLLQLWDEDDVLATDTLRRTEHMCPTYEQEERSGGAGRMVTPRGPSDIPFRPRTAASNFLGRHRIMRPKEH